VKDGKDWQGSSHVRHPIPIDVSQAFDPFVGKIPAETDPIAIWKFLEGNLRHSEVAKGVFWAFVGFYHFPSARIQDGCCHWFCLGCRLCPYFRWQYGAANSR